MPFGAVLALRVIQAVGVVGATVGVLGVEQGGGVEARPGQSDPHRPRTVGRQIVPQQQRIRAVGRDHGGDGDGRLRVAVAGVWKRPVGVFER